jgi:hypothetical protein
MRKVRINYVNSGNSLKLSYSNDFIRFSGDAVEVINGATDATHWVLERVNDPAGGYIY